MTLIGKLYFRWQKKKLLKILQEANPRASLIEQLHWIKHLFLWIRKPKKIIDNHDTPQIDRILFLMLILKENPELNIKVSETLTHIIREVQPLDFFCDAGLIDTHAFIGEFFRILALRFLPIYRDFNKLTPVLEYILHTKKDKEWLKQIDQKLIDDLKNALQLSEEFLLEIKKKYLLQLYQSKRILSARIGSLATKQEFRDKLPDHEKLTLLDLTLNQSPEKLAQSKDLIANVYEELSESGVSIELVFLLERLRLMLQRLETFENLESNQFKLSDILNYIVNVLNSLHSRNSIAGFLKSNLKLLSKKITERAGVSGEHYISRTRKGSIILFASAAGGGILTVATTITKSKITHENFPLFIEGFFAFINYSMSFMVLQLIHFILATKTPAMTASFLAAKLREIKDSHSIQSFVDEVVHIVRSGFIAILGNVIFVIIGAVLVDVVYFNYYQRHVFDSEISLSYLNAHDPLSSLTLFYAFYTGIALWLGSAIGGWFENWFVYRRLPRAIEENRTINKLFGHKRSRDLSFWFRMNIMGFATNFALGFILAFSSIFGKFFGIPLDVRHVTLSSGTVALSYMGATHLDHNLLFRCGISIICIGFLNFSVSFVISLIVALQARGIVLLRKYPQVIKHIFLRILTRPFSFFIP